MVVPFASERVIVEFRRECGIDDEQSRNSKQICVERFAVSPF